MPGTQQILSATMLPRCAGVLFAWLAVTPLQAGEIPGLLPQLPPFHERDFEFVFSNDFLGRGGSVDDFRTQQLILSTRLTDRWFALLDHSILTLDRGPDAGRIDQLTLSAGYQLIARTREDRTDRVAAGFGARDSGSYGGERIQNGFHRLIGSEIEELPYVPGNDAEATVWLDASHYRLLQDTGEGRLLRSWRRGAWFRGGSLVTSGGEWDGTVSALAVASRSSIDVWFGVRTDWRRGYGSAVLEETAQAEEDVALVFGARFGPLVIETVQQLNNEASYGQLRLVSTGRRNVPSGKSPGPFALEFGFSMPDVTMRVVGKVPLRLPVLGRSGWQESLMLAASHGEPQYKNDNRLFVRSSQLDVGLEFERPWADDNDWLSVYALTSAGWREQALIAVNEAQAVKSGSVGRAVLTAGGGIRVLASGPPGGWRLRIQAGLLGTFPLADAELALDGGVYRVQERAINVLLGFTIEFE